MSDLKCARELVLAPERNLQLVELMLEHNAGAEEMFGFHVQQAVEKLLKAWLAIRGESYLLTNDLEQLFAALARGGIELQAFRSLAEYTPFAVVHRYEALGTKRPPMDRAQAAFQTASLLARVKEFLSEPSRA